MVQQSTASQEGDHTGSPRSQRTQIRMTTANLADRCRDGTDLTVLTPKSSSSGLRGNAANTRLSQTRSSSQQQRLRRQSDGGRRGSERNAGDSSNSTRHQTYGARAKAPLALLSRPLTQEWPAQTSDEEEEEEEDEAASQDEEADNQRSQTTEPLVQTPSPPSRSPSQSPAPLSTLQQDDSYAPITSEELQRSSSFSQLVCGQRILSMSSSNVAEGSQPYEALDAEDYEYYSDNFMDIATPGDPMQSWNETPSRALKEQDSDLDKEVQSDDDQDEVVESTLPYRRRKSPTELDVEANVTTPGSPAKAAADWADWAEAKTVKRVYGKSRRQGFSKVADCSPTPVPDRDTSDRLKTDRFQGQLSPDTIAFLARNRSIEEVFLCVEIPALPVINTQTRTRTTAMASGKTKAKARVAVGEKKRVVESPSRNTRSPSSSSQSRQLRKRSVQEDTNGHQSNNMRSNLRTSSLAVAIGSYLEEDTEDGEEEVESDRDEEADNDEQDKRASLISAFNRRRRSNSTRLLPLKKRIRRLESSQEQEPGQEQEQELYREQDHFVQDQDQGLDPELNSDSDEGRLVLSQKSCHRGRANRLASRSPNQEEPDPDDQEDFADEPSATPVPDSSLEKMIRPSDVDVEDPDLDQDLDLNLDLGDEQQQPWELVRLRQVWKHHGVRWPLRTTAVTAVALPRRLSETTTTYTTTSSKNIVTAEGYSAFFIFGSALPLPN
ncbi:hypothetical protein BGX33_007619 [Mortierella sp. NVP41]|nr:hypothetical protein BGX33_007619 [Mortierella sp. NVP41]